MPINKDIVASAERLFDHDGFSRTGMDRLVAAAGVSSRTLYKRIGNKAALIDAVLKARDERFFEQFSPACIDDLFLALARWVDKEGARGCLFMRAASEMGGSGSDVAGIMARHKTRTRSLIAELLDRELGADAHNHADNREDLVDQLLVLFEGATVVAVYRGQTAIDAARRAAATLIAGNRSPA